jgi:transcription initiation factor IIE alpha subunit
MTIELTDAKRYEMEKDNVINLILAANRRKQEITAEIIAHILNIDIETTDRLLAALRAENIIK